MSKFKNHTFRKYSVVRGFSGIENLMVNTACDFTLFRKMTPG